MAINNYRNIIWIIVGLLGFFIVMRIAFKYLIDFSNSDATSAKETIHPRGIINYDQVQNIKERLARDPFKTFFQVYQDNIHRMEDEIGDNPESDIYDHAYLAGNQGFMYLLTDDDSYIKKSWNHIDKVMESDYWKDPLSRGLTRAALLQQLALAYDFTYNGLDKLSRNSLNNELYRVMFNTNASMGYSANYSIASNWMGVRFGSVILAAKVYDPDPQNERSAALPVLWDASKRLQDHLDANLYANGWNGESLGYHNYDWLFVGPAIASLQLNSNATAFDLEQFAPKAVNSIQAHAAATVAIQTDKSLGIKPDISDDNLTTSLLSTIALGFRYYPQDQLPALKWMHDYLFKADLYQDNRGLLLHSILNYPDQIASVNPANLGWRKYHDEEQGIVIFRNQFKDENDIVSLYTATATRVKGHRGPDTNTFRLIGLGVPWIVGAGRTNEIAGQTNLFPAAQLTPEKGDLSELGTLHHFEFFENGGGFALGSGSCVGVEDHRRFFYTSYDEKTGAEAMLVISELSDNGKRWRLNTPEFNEFQQNGDGYTLTAPNGASMKVNIFDVDTDLKVDTGRVKYGGSTVRNNPGIIYRGQSYSYNRWIDVHCERKITAVITLQPKGKEHPQIIKSGNEISAGSFKVKIPFPQLQASGQ